MKPKIQEDELDVQILQTPDKLFSARVLHKPTMTLKISEPCDSAQEAVTNAVQELVQLVAERQDGLGN